MDARLTEEEGIKFYLTKFANKLGGSIPTLKKNTEALVAATR